MILRGKLQNALRVTDLTDEYINSITQGKTVHGTGGMARKLQIARDMVKESDGKTQVRILNGKKPEQLAGYFYGDKVGTKIVI